MQGESIKLEKGLIRIPKYTLGEELISAISHGIGAGLGIAALVLCIVKSAIHHNPYAVVSSCLYGSTLIILYLISTLYHSFKPSIGAKRVFRIFDHCSIFLLIFGTYAPFTLVTLNGGVRMGYFLYNISYNSTWYCVEWDKFRKIQKNIDGLLYNYGMDDYICI